MAFNYILIHFLSKNETVEKILIFTTKIKFSVFKTKFIFNEILKYIKQNVDKNAHRPFKFYNKAFHSSCIHAKSIYRFNFKNMKLLRSTKVKRVNPYTFYL